MTKMGNDAFNQSVDGIPRMNFSLRDGMSTQLTSTARNSLIEQRDIRGSLFHDDHRRAA